MSAKMGAMIAFGTILCTRRGSSSIAVPSKTALEAAWFGTEERRGVAGEARRFDGLACRGSGSVELELWNSGR